MVIANFLGTNLVDIVFANPRQHGSLEVLVGVYAYAVQIYADFSGYTDMAIGLALLLGIRFPQNFDSPYTATSAGLLAPMAHDPVPLAARLPVHPARRQPERRLATYRNLMITFLLGGLWHGAVLDVRRVGRDPRGRARASSTGDDHAAACTRMPRPRARVDTRALRRFVTFQIVCFAWIFFRAESFSNAWAVITQIVNPAHWGQGAPLVTGGVLLAIAAGIVEQYIPRELIGKAMSAFSRLTLVGQGVLLGVVLLITNSMGPRGVAPFIYFRF